MVETDEFARKRQQLEQLKTDLENKLGASRVQWTTAIREGHSSNQERTAFINNYEAQCSRLRELFGEQWDLERELRSIQQSLSCSPATRPGASRPTSPSCRSWCVGPEHRATTRHSVISITLTAARRWQAPQRRAEGLLHCYLSPPWPRPRACRSAPVVGATPAHRRQHRQAAGHPEAVLTRLRRGTGY